MSKVEFIKKLNNQQWIDLIDKVIPGRKLNGITYSFVTPLEEWDEKGKVLVDIAMERVMTYCILNYRAQLEVSDYELTLMEGIWHSKHDKTLHLFLTSLFGEDYADSLYQHRIDEAQENASEEKQKLLAATGYDLDAYKRELKIG